mmetsp:Transcript_20984/g.49513  ORF Transcript_20984/g.49513 Transcript_20984/m.49513 type:complete len:202 (-) Transcript_20984:1320-1925(-)
MTESGLSILSFPLALSSSDSVVNEVSSSASFAASFSISSMMEEAALSLASISTDDLSLGFEVLALSDPSDSVSGSSSSRIACLIRTRCSRSFTTGSADNNWEIDSISSGESSRSPISISAAFAFKSSFNSSTFTSMASKISSLLISPASAVVEATSTLSVFWVSGAVFCVSSFSEVSFFFFASLSACSSLIFSFCCFTTSS